MQNQHDLCITCGDRPGVPRPLPLRTVHCGPCWAAHGGSPDAAEIGPVPAQALGSRDPRSQVEWLEALAGEEWVQLLQLRTRRRLYALAHCLAAHADWETFETWPTWDRLIAATGWARSTMAAWLRTLRVTGWLATIEHGSTPQYRPMGLSTTGNRAAVYALRIPMRPGEVAAERGPDILQRLADIQAAEQRRLQRRRAELLGPIITTAPVDVDKTWTPTLSPSGESVTCEGGSFAREGDVHKIRTEVSASTENIEALRARFDEKQGSVFGARAPVTRAEMLAAAAELRREHAVLARLSAKWVRSLCRPFWQAGWTNDDVLHALRYRPTSWSTLPAMPAERIVVPARWIASRLAAWRDHRGHVLPGRRQRTQDMAQIEQTVGAQAVRHTLGHTAVDLGDTVTLADVLARLTPEAIRQRGRHAHRQLRAEHEHQQRRQRRDSAHTPTPRELAADEATRARARAALAADLQRRAAERTRADQLQRDLIRQAHRLAAARGDQAAEQRGTIPPAEPAATPDERWSRARDRARRERRYR